MTLAALAKDESEIDCIVQRCTGLIDEKHRQLEAAGVFTRYAQIHDAYLALSTSAAFRREALKRAAFIGWYSHSEPSSFTGIGEIAPNQTREAFISLDHLLISDGGDEELDWMLPWYHDISSFVLDALVDPDQRLLAVRAVVAKSASVKLPKRAPMPLLDRGIMGKYWTSIFNAAASR